MSRRWNILGYVLLCAMLSAPAPAFSAPAFSDPASPDPAFSDPGQQRQKDPLNDAQTEELREAADQPGEKIKLYIKYIEERTVEMHRLEADLRAQNKAVQMHNLYEEFTRLADELQDNMDAYSAQHEDMRKALKQLVEKSEKWPAVLNEPRPSSEYDFARKTALEAAASTHEAAQKMLDEEVKYFAEHKGERKSGS